MSIKQVKDGCWVYSDGQQVCYPYPSGGEEEASLLDSLIDGSITEISSNVTRINETGFHYQKALTRVSFPYVTGLYNYAFAECIALQTADLPSVTGINGYSFDGCYSLTTVNMPELTEMYSGYNFRKCIGLTTVNFPKLTNIGSNTFDSCQGLKSVVFPLVGILSNQAFTTCSALTTADFSSVTSIMAYAFNWCSVLTTLILRNETMASLANTSAFNQTPIKNGTGYIYVPSALIDSYKAATNWSAFAAQFRALEDYTVDGTVTGELDESKI